MARGVSFFGARKRAAEAEVAGAKSDREAGHQDSGVELVATRVSHMTARDPRDT